MTAQVEKVKKRKQMNRANVKFLMDIGMKRYNKWKPILLIEESNWTRSVEWQKMNEEDWLKVKLKEILI
jgi:hypothetical protein